MIVFNYLVTNIIIMYTDSLKMFVKVHNSENYRKSTKNSKSMPTKKNCINVWQLEKKCMRFLSLV